MFLWGARQTGKSTFLRERFPESAYFDLLNTDLYTLYDKEPWAFREAIRLLPAEQKEHPIIIDEIQRVPELLNEVHGLIENEGLSFILCGSSARKLRRGGVNLLGGRAWSYYFYPLVYPELKDADLLRVLNYGTIPAHYLSEYPKKELKNYIGVYLREEIQAEGLVRQLNKFSRFLDSVAFSHGEILNYANIARDCHIDGKTVKEYYQILVDTLIGYFIEPYAKKNKRNIIVATPKFYLFDIGVANALKGVYLEKVSGSEAGRAFEHFILLELIAYKGLQDKDFKITFWRTNDSKYEMDFILGDAEVAIEVKLTQSVNSSHFKSIKVFAEEHSPRTIILVCQEPRPRLIQQPYGDVMVLPYKDFLEKLWAGNIIS